MRILFAHKDKSEKTGKLQALAKYGVVDSFENGRDVVVSFVNGFQTGNRYDLLVIDYDLKQLDGLETIVMIRTFESEHLATDRKALIVYSSKDTHFRSLYEARHGMDERISFEDSPVNFSTLECNVKKIAAVKPVKTFWYGRPVHILA